MEFVEKYDNAPGTLNLFFDSLKFLIDDFLRLVQYIENVVGWNSTDERFLLCEIKPTDVLCLLVD